MIYAIYTNEKTFLQIDISSSITPHFQKKYELRRAPQLEGKDDSRPRVCSFHQVLLNPPWRGTSAAPGAPGVKHLLCCRHGNDGGDGAGGLMEYQQGRMGHGVQLCGRVEGKGAIDEGCLGIIQPCVEGAKKQGNDPDGRCVNVNIASGTGRFIPVIYRELCERVLQMTLVRASCLLLLQNIVTQWRPVGNRRLKTNDKQFLIPTFQFKLAENLHLLIIVLMFCLFVKALYWVCFRITFIYILRHSTSSSLTFKIICL